MRLFSIELQIVSPTILVSRTGYRGFAYKSLYDYIPASTFRGALMSGLMLNYNVDMNVIDKLVLDPDYSITPLLATEKTPRSFIRDIMVAHALSIKMKWPVDKIEGVILSRGIGRLLDMLRTHDPKEALLRLIVDTNRELLQGKSLARRSMHPSETTVCTGDVIIRDGKYWRGVKVETDMYTQVGLDQVRGSAVPALLYSYEHIKPGNIYVGYMAISEKSSLLEMLKDMKNIRICLGRGISRGFGRALVSLEEIDLNHFLNTIGLERVRRGDYIALEVLSLALRETPIPLPLRSGDVIEIPTPWMEKILGHLDTRVKLRILAILGNTSSYGGWSIRTNKPKLMVKGIGRGGLLICRVEEAEGREVERLLSMLAIVGLDHLASHGYNIMIPLLKDPIAWG